MTACDMGQPDEDWGEVCKEERKHEMSKRIKAADNPTCTSQAPGRRPVIDRRQVWRYGLIGTVGAIVGLESGAARAQGKATKKQAGYIPRGKAGQSCATCGYFNQPTNCVLVQGPVSPSGWCSYYAP